MTYRGIFIDDEDDIYADLLSSGQELKVVFVPVAEVSRLAGEISRDGPDIVAIDYRLDEVVGAVPPDQLYKGSALAQHLRDIAIEFPDRDCALVLISAEAKVRALFDPDKTAHDLFDKVYLKEDVRASRDQVIVELSGLCQAYIDAKMSARPYSLSTLMRAQEADLPNIDFQELRRGTEGAAAPHILVRLFLRTLIDRSGPLIDHHEVAARLGLETISASSVQKLLHESSAYYSGFLSAPWPRWWSHRIDAFAGGLFGRRATGLTATERAVRLSEITGEQLQPARSPWNRSSDELIAFACASCRRGTELKHSLAAYDGAMPKYVSRRRVCWDCVQTDAYEIAGLSLDDADNALAGSVRSMERS